MRTVLVTGASRIGRALALSLAQPGWDVGQIAVTQAVLSRIRSARRRIVFNLPG